MKKLLLLSLIVMFSGTIQAAELFANLTACRHEMRRMLGLDTASTNTLTDTAANQFLRIAIVDCAPSIFARRYTKKMVTTDQVYEYALDSIVRVERVEMKYSDSLKPLLFVPRELWYKQSHLTTKAQKFPDLARPSYYDYDDSNIIVFPFPSRTDSIFITGAVKVQSIDTLTSLTRYPEKLRIAFVWRASYLHLLSKLDQRRVEFYQQYMNVKQEVDRIYGRESLSDTPPTH